MAFRLVFDGKLEPGVTPAQSALRIARLYGKPADAIQSYFFSGKPVVIKTVVSEDDEEVRRCIAAFARAGAILEVQETP